jgi:hypothetical protein
MTVLVAPPLAIAAMTTAALGEGDSEVDSEGAVEAEADCDTEGDGDSELREPAPLREGLADVDSDAEEPKETDGEPVALREAVTEVLRPDVSDGLRDGEAADRLGEPEAEEPYETDGDGDRLADSCSGDALADAPTLGPAEGDATLLAEADALVEPLAEADAVVEPLAVGDASSVRLTEVVSDADGGGEAEALCDGLTDGEAASDAVTSALTVTLALTLAELLAVQLAVADIRTAALFVYCEERAFARRMFLLYDGVHYDALFAASGARLFAPSDAAAAAAAVEVADALRREHAFTDTAHFMLACGACGALVAGTAEAQAHAEATGHGSFVERRPPAA